MIELLSIELTNKCSKACSFCYNASNVKASVSWNANKLIDFINDCVDNDVKVISFGGGEPLEYPELIEVLEKTKGIKTLTTNGLLLNTSFIDTFKRTLSKVQLSIHFPSDVDRVIKQALELNKQGLTCGVNLLVRASNTSNTWIKEAVKKLQDFNIPIIYLPMRVFDDEPTPEQVHAIANTTVFESVQCLTGCVKSERFASIDFNHKVGWCSYTSERHEVSPLTFKGLKNALGDLGLTYCGESSRLSRIRVKVKEVEKPVTTKIKKLAPVDLPVATAHSTDTSWYAVDGCGHVANFWSSESGLVPEGIVQGTQDIGFSENEERLTVTNASEFLQTLDLFRHVKDPKEARVAIFKVNEALTAVAVPALLTNKVIGGFFSGKLLLETTTNRDDFLTIYAQFHKLCVACFKFYGYIQFPTIVRQGLFTYKHPIWNSQAFPYRRVFVPSHPIITDRDDLVKFNSFCFARKRQIQPSLYLPCDVPELEDDPSFIVSERTNVDNGVSI